MPERVTIVSREIPMIRDRVHYKDIGQALLELHGELPALYTAKGVQEGTMPWPDHAVPVANVMPRGNRLKVALHPRLLDRRAALTMELMGQAHAAQRALAALRAIAGGAEDPKAVAQAALTDLGEAKSTVPHAEMSWEAADASV